MGWSGLSSEDVFKYGLVGLVASLVLGAPQQVLQSLKRWLGDPPARPAPRTTPPSASQLTTRLKRLMRPTLLLVPATAAGLSKLGGDPELPPDLAWPAAVPYPNEQNTPSLDNTADRTAGSSTNPIPDIAASLPSDADHGSAGGAARDISSSSSNSQSEELAPAGAEVS